MLNQLPAPPSGKTGWPWTEESEYANLHVNEGKALPRISIITPSFNQGEFIEETIRSIILQNYSNLEYIIIDGCSTDNSVEIIRRYEPWLSFWTSEPDNGQSHAINKGFERCTGDLVNWICSDDLLCKNALNKFASEFYSGNNYCYIGKCLLVDKSGKNLGSTISSISDIDELTDIPSYWRKKDSIAQQSALYPLNVVNKIGGLKEKNHYTMDYELWGELLLNNISIRNIPLEIGIYRWYEGQKTSYTLKVTRSLVATAISLINKNQGYSYRQRLFKSVIIFKYYLSFIYHHFRSFLGIKRRIFKVSNNGI